MLVHQVNRYCNVCGISKDSAIIDIPFEEIKLAPFAVKCECGYFYESFHYATSFRNWRIARETIVSKINYLNRDIEIEKKVLSELPGTLRIEVKIKQLEKKLIELNTQLDEISTVPIPDHLWKD